MILFNCIGNSIELNFRYKGFGEPGFLRAWKAGGETSNYVLMIFQEIKQQILKQVRRAYKNLFKKEMKEGVQVELTSDMQFGEFTVKCFSLGENPKEIAQSLARVLPQAQAVGPYLNFRIDYQDFGKKVLKEVLSEAHSYGRHSKGQQKKILLEFAHPNTHKQFHIGHLRNLITGAALIKILENAGYKVIKVNYQGDIGLHVAKSLYGVLKMKEEDPLIIKTMRGKTLDEKVEFLGRAYALGAEAYEREERARTAIQKINKEIYQYLSQKERKQEKVSSKQQKFLQDLYQETRRWSLTYFDEIYKRFNISFDRLYFESEVFERGREIVFENINIFKKSNGALIFEGEKYNLHNRVFLTSEGLATYEAKDLALAELQFKEYQPDLVLHLVASEQTNYFKVLFKVLEKIMPNTKGKEKHLRYGLVQLKEGKMSSRKGRVVAGKWLLEEVKRRLNDQEKVAQAAVRYSMLKNSREQDIFFDIDQSISLSGNSGPYLQYTYARAKSILRKAEVPLEKPTPIKRLLIPKTIEQNEKQLIFKLALFPEITLSAAKNYEPSVIAKYLFDLGQIFNNYYHRTPVIQSSVEQKMFRLMLVKAVSVVLKNGLRLLGIEAPERM